METFVWCSMRENVDFTLNLQSEVMHCGGNCKLCEWLFAPLTTDLKAKTYLGYVNLASIYLPSQLIFRLFCLLVCNGIGLVMVKHHWVRDLEWCSNMSRNSLDQGWLYRSVLLHMWLSILYRYIIICDGERRLTTVRETTDKSVLNTGFVMTACHLIIFLSCLITNMVRS